MTCSLSLKKFMQNNVERKVNEFVNAHEKKLKLALRGYYKLQRSAAKDKFLIVRFETKDDEFWGCLMY